MTFSLEEDRMNGFWWTGELSAIFSQSGNTTPAALSGRGERVCVFFEEWARDPRAGIARVQAAVAGERAARLRIGPQILSLMPPDGESAVDPAVGFMELRFDRPMSGGMSLYGDSPQLAGRPAWNADKTTLRIPVTLKPGTKYVVRINSDKEEGGFRSAAGEKLVPRTWSFAVK